MDAFCRMCRNAAEDISEPSIVMDILPTTLKMVGSDVPSNLDGTSLALRLTEREALQPDRPLFFYRSGQLRSMRKGKRKGHVPHMYVSMTEESWAEMGSGGHPGKYGAGKKPLRWPVHTPRLNAILVGINIYVGTVMHD